MYDKLLVTKRIQITLRGNKNHILLNSPLSRRHSMTSMWPFCTHGPWKGYSSWLSGDGGDKGLLGIGVGFHFQTICPGFDAWRDDWLLESYFLATSKVISGWVLMGGSAHSWKLYSAAPLWVQATSTMLEWVSCIYIYIYIYMMYNTLCEYRNAEENCFLILFIIIILILLILQLLSSRRPRTGLVTPPAAHRSPKAVTKCRTVSIHTVHIYTHIYIMRYIFYKSPIFKWCQ